MRACVRASVHPDLHVQMRLHAAAPQRWIARKELLLPVDERADQTNQRPMVHHCRRSSSRCAMAGSIAM